MRDVRLSAVGSWLASLSSLVTIMSPPLPIATDQNFTRHYSRSQRCGLIICNNNSSMRPGLKARRDRHTGKLCWLAARTRTRGHMAALDCGLG